MLADFSTMQQYFKEKQLAITYILCTIAGAIASITTGVAWGHWKGTLDQCIGRNCSCILFGEHTPSKFLGGDISPCIWVTFGPLFYVLFCIAMTCFHGYRVLFSFESSKTRTIMRKNSAGEMVQVHTIQAEDTSPLPRAFWITVATFSSIFTVYSLIHFVVFIAGYYRTCNQFRNTLENLLCGTGNSKIVIHNRLACQGVFDFMDYLQQDSGNAVRDGIINTGLDLIIGLIASFFSWWFFAFASILNIQMAKVRY